MYGRIYDPKVARFMSGDPFIQSPGNSQSFNRYSYVWNNPTNLTDPSGFVAVDFENGGSGSYSNAGGEKAERGDNYERAFAASASADRSGIGASIPTVITENLYEFRRHVNVFYTLHDAAHCERRINHG